LKQRDGDRAQVELHYYKKEYEKLFKDQKAELHRLHKKKGEKDSNNAPGSGNKKTISALQSKIDKLENLLNHTIRAMESRDNGGDDDTEEKCEKK
jgi:hypothetical protein